jgi:hypothetical protein
MFATAFEISTLPNATNVDLKANTAKCLTIKKVHTINPITAQTKNDIISPSNLNIKTSILDMASPQQLGREEAQIFEILMTKLPKQHDFGQNPRLSRKLPRQA